MLHTNDLREKDGYTYGKLSEAVGVERSLISKIETECARYSPDTAKAMAKVLGVSNGQSL